MIERSEKMSISALVLSVIAIACSLTALSYQIEKGPENPSGYADEESPDIGDAKLRWSTAVEVPGGGFLIPIGPPLASQASTPKEFSARIEITPEAADAARACEGVERVRRNRYSVDVFRGPDFDWSEIDECVEKAIKTE